MTDHDMTSSPPADCIIAPGDAVDFPDHVTVTTPAGWTFDVPVASAVADSMDGRHRVFGEFRNGRFRFGFNAEGRYRVRLRNAVGQTLHEVVVWAMPRAALPKATVVIG